MQKCNDPKDVPVREYKRTRFGKTEFVNHHFRKHPT